MPSKRRRLDPVGPFGNPDGSRADIEDVISEFVDFGGDPAYGHLATRANDSMVRVIVGKLGAGKTVYLRRLQDFQAHQDSVYADVPQQSLPKTEVVVKACQWFSDRVLVEKWMQIWERAIMRSLASHLLCRPELRQQLRDEQADEIEHAYARLLDDFRRPRSIYSQVRDIINSGRTTPISCPRTLTIRSGMTSRTCSATSSASASRSTSTSTRSTRSSATPRCTG